MFTRRISIAIFALVLALYPLANVRGDVRLPHVIGSGMVLQREAAAPLWGWADPGETVTVTLGDTKLAPVQAGADGKWMVKLPPQKAGGPVRITVAGKNTIELDDILFGDVWLCSGQSNMEMSPQRIDNAVEEMGAARYPSIRLFSVGRKVAQTPQDDCEGQWQACDPITVRTFSAVGYFFGRDLHKELDVPIGLINSSWGGTPAEAWTPLATLQAEPEFATILQRTENYANTYPQLLEKYEADLARWETVAALAKEDGQPVPRKPNAPPKTANNPQLPAVLYNARIHPLVPFAIKGAIWYQGESNAGRAWQYRTLLPAMITSWRQTWTAAGQLEPGQGDFPFGIVQLANYTKRLDQPAESTWAELREAQVLTAKNVPNCGLAVIIDIGDAKDIHPTNKQDVGKRLALWALAQVYAKDVEYSGPVYDTMKIEGNTIRLTFSHVKGGLVIKEGDTLKGFAIAGDDRKFVWADARIDGDSVIVSSPAAGQPVAVRYAWASNPECNLFNKADLPASPFRTDDWPLTTAKAQ
ncbi:MAG: sialate O-acetylesterase [Phycisphaeraceae bacterium]